MQTFHIRMKAHAETTTLIRDWLRNHPGVKKVYYPEIDGVQLTGYATLLFFDLREDLIDLYPQFIAALRWFDTGTGMACVTSMIARPYTGSHASMADEEKATIGLTQQLVRLSIGLENTQDLIDDLSQAFEAIGVRQGL